MVAGKNHGSVCEVNSVETLRWIDIMGSIDLHTQKIWKRLIHSVTNREKLREFLRDIAKKWQRYVQMAPTPTI